MSTKKWSLLVRERVARDARNVFYDPKNPEHTADASLDLGLARVMEFATADAQALNRRQDDRVAGLLKLLDQAGVKK